jgi:outer membrane protein OmpA-like peptidoglycan-associated protein
MRYFLFILCFSLLISCAAPKPKTLSGKNRVPINSNEIVIPKPEKPEPVFVARPPEPVKFTFHFEFERTDLTIPNDALHQLLSLAMQAKQIHIRGRTDNTKESNFDLNIAKGRALAARNILIENGVNPQTIFIEYSSASDYISENITNEGRAKNRRVEILIPINHTEL